MHNESMLLMVEMVQDLTTGRKVLDVGSYDVNGTYRPLIESLGHTYTGVDIQDGPNVDVVMEQPYLLPFEDGEFDLVISGSVMEHVAKPWLWIPELCRVLKPGGRLCVVTHWSFPFHEYPIDTFRYMPDGLRSLLSEASNMKELDIRMANSSDVVLKAEKNLTTTKGKKSNG